METVRGSLNFKTLQGLNDSLVVELKESHLRHNLRVLKELQKTKSPFFCAMVKANAYGHGLLEVSHILEDEGVSAFGVSSAEEVRTLRQNGITKTPILLFNSTYRQGASLLEQLKATPVVGSFLDLEILNKTASSSQKLPVHININTGMSRLDFSIKDLVRLKKFFQKPSCRLHLEGISTHSCFAEDIGFVRGQTLSELEKFLEITSSVFSSEFNNLQKHALRSASLLGLWALKENHLMETLGARVGGALYGIQPGPSFLNPLVGKKALRLCLKPVMTLKASVFQYQRVFQGQTVSYNHSWVAEKDSVVAVVPFGYAHGFFRSTPIGASSGSYFALFRGQKVPVIGTVNMDCLFLDVTSVVEKLEDELAEDQVTFIGEGLSVEEVAERLGTIAYDIVVQIHSHIPRQVVF